MRITKDYSYCRLISKFCMYNMNDSRRLEKISCVIICNDLDK